jgi:hypothetical protein
MAGCDVLFYDPAHAGPGLEDGWRPCPASGQVWTDPDQVLRFVCATHRRQLSVLYAAGLAGRVRWGRPGLAIHLRTTSLHPRPEEPTARSVPPHPAPPGR